MWRAQLKVGDVRGSEQTSTAVCQRSSRGWSRGVPCDSCYLLFLNQTSTSPAVDHNCVCFSFSASSDCFTQIFHETPPCSPPWFDLHQVQGPGSCFLTLWPCCVMRSLVHLQKQSSYFTLNASRFSSILYSKYIELLSSCQLGYLCPRSYVLVLIPPTLVFSWKKNSKEKENSNSCKKWLLFSAGTSGVSSCR